MADDGRIAACQKEISRLRYAVQEWSRLHEEYVDVVRCMKQVIGPVLRVPNKHVVYPADLLEGFEEIASKIERLDK